MPNAFRTACCTVLILAGLSGATPRSLAAPPEDAKKPEIKPEVLAFLKQSTDAYKKMKSYYADISLKTEAIQTGGAPINETARFVLALDRPNKFCYKAITNKTASAVSDGKTFFNYSGNKTNQYMKLTAPVDYKGINIVDDVTFEPLGTYLIALMLQGDALADKDVRMGFEKASLGPVVIENGKKLQTLHMLFGPQEEAYDFYFSSEDHLLSRAVMKMEFAQGKVTQTETLENIKIDKPIESSVFDYTPPADAHKVDHFSAPQRREDAHNRRPNRTRLAAF